MNLMIPNKHKYRYGDWMWFKGVIAIYPVSFPTSDGLCNFALELENNDRPCGYDKIEICCDDFLHSELIMIGDLLDTLPEMLSEKGVVYDHSLTIKIPKRAEREEMLNGGFEKGCLCE